MSSYKLVAIDLDDTLLPDDLTISPRVKEILQKVRDRGVIITLATGRMYRSTLPYAQQLAIEVPLITYHGALIKNSLSGETLCHYPVPLDKAREIISLVKEDFSFHINAYVEDNLYVEGISQEAEGYAKLAGVPLYKVGNLLEFLHREPTKLVLIASEQQLDALAIRLKEIYSGALYITKSKPNYLEILNVKANKGQALDTLAKLLKINQREIMAFGDSYNDLEMLRYAGTAVVMGNAREEIKEEADYVTLSNNEDGVADALEKLILNN